MTLAVRIQHHPDRVRHLHFLLRALDTHATKDFKVIENTQGTWMSCVACLESAGFPSTHILIMQDDVLPCRDLIATATKLIEVVPDRPITLFTNRDTAMTAQAIGKHWMTVRAWFMAQAYILPARFIIDFMKWDLLHWRPGREGADDEHLALFCFMNEIKVMATVPSLVEHIGWRTTTIGDRNNKNYLDVTRRIASTFIGYESSGLDIDWSKGLEAPHPDTWGSWDQFSDWYRE